MTRLASFSILVLMSLLLAATASAQTLQATLTGAAEPGGGDADGSGFSTVVFNPARTQILIEVDVKDLDVITAAHIHRTSTSGIEVFITNGATFSANGRIAVVRDISPALATEMSNNPAEFYVNVHTALFPNGAIRGTLGQSAVELMATLLGSNEVGGGDPDGSGVAMLALSGNRTQLFVEIFIMNISAVNGAHIHEGAAGVDGGVVVDLMGAATFTNNTLRTNVPITPDLAARIVSNPAGFYVNVHTTEHGGGAIRGQLVNLEGDVNDDNQVTVADIFYLINYMFGNGPVPK